MAEEDSLRRLSTILFHMCEVGDVALFITHESKPHRIPPHSVTFCSLVRLPSRKVFWKALPEGNASEIISFVCTCSASCVYCGYTSHTARLCFYDTPPVVSIPARCAIRWCKVRGRALVIRSARLSEVCTYWQRRSLRSTCSRSQ